MPTEVDVGGVQPTARAAVSAAATIIQRHLGADLVTLVAHGSAVKGGFIAGCSDIDLRAYVTAERLTVAGGLPLEAALRLYHDLARIETQPFRYLQLYLGAAGQTPGAGATGLIPGAYALICGASCVPLATAGQLRRGARATLGRLDAAAVERRLGDYLLGGGLPSAGRELRWLCTDVWPVLYHVLALADGDPLAMWRLSKPEAIAHTSADGELGSRIRHFWRALATHYATGETLPTALASLEAGVAFLYAAQHWYASKEHVV